MTVKIFITGASGFIGGSVLSLLLKNPNFEVTALIRDKERAKKLDDLGVKSAIGSLDDSKLLTSISEESDVVLHTADADHLGSVKAIIKGLNQRSEKSKKKPILIHTSGTGVLMEIFNGDQTERFFPESALGDIEGHPKNALHREIDIEVLQAGESGKIDAIIVCPPMIYGEGTGPFNQHSVQIPLMITSSIKAKTSFYVGKGLNIWNNVHVLDLADFYILVLEAALNGKAPVNRDGYYFCENGEAIIGEINQALAKCLHKRGLVAEPVSKSVSEEEGKKLYGPFGGAVTSNSRGKAEKARKLGWKPTRPSLFETLDAEVEFWKDKKFSH